MILYTDIDPRVCAWTEELIAMGEIPTGTVLCKSIVDLNPQDLNAYTQVHFFNGISGWSAALKLAGWPDNRPVWCASLPCQPFSAAGKQEGVEDERHLWPVFFALLRANRPAVVLGEQVSSPLALGWLDGVFADLEGEGYACEAFDLCAASVGAPDIRQRIYWVAYALCAGSLPATHAGIHRGEEGAGSRDVEPLGHRGDVRMADADGSESGHGQLQPSGEHGQQPEDSGAGRVEHAASDGRIERRTESGERGIECGCRENFWSRYSLIECTDGKVRRVPPIPEPGIQLVDHGLSVDVDAGWRQSNGQVWPLAKGVKGRVGLLFGAGNAIVPELAAEFIGAFIDVHGYPPPR